MVKILPSRRSQKIKSFIAMDILDQVHQMREAGEDVISLAIGEPDLPSPQEAKRACIEAIEKDFTQYTHSQGLLELREAIVEYYFKRYRVKLHPEQVIVTSGSSPAFFLTFSSLLNPQDEVILSDPHYPCYSNFIEFLEGRPVYVRVKEEDQFQYRPEAVQKKLSSKTKAILINSPSNPTGYLIPDETIRALAAFKPYLVSDEIYHGLVYDGQERSVLEFTDRAFVLNGFSKAFSMTGFRLGYVIAPKDFIRPMQKIQQNFYISVSSFSQKAGLAALKQAQSSQLKLNQVFKKRRDLALRCLKKIGVEPAHLPEGAFYIFLNVKKYTRDSYRFAFDCLKKNKVGVTPGIDFGKGGEGYIRISYATSEKNIREGIRRLGNYLEGI
ncbi:MAG: pyridoxal phosphate-dependent aminotransferase [Deltaproteobacteria bacterium]|nr:pyridoxal phosphate-dependent aminotransferase [Deltaproteobacteria bacterium]